MSHDPPPGAAVANRGLTSQPSRIGQRHWPVFVLLLALAFVGHDVVMTSPVAHAVPEATPLAHHQAPLPSTNLVLVMDGDWATTALQHMSPCLASRVAKAPSGMTVQAEREIANAVLPVDRLVQKQGDVVIATDLPPPLPPDIRRALLQVFLM